MKIGVLGAGLMSDALATRWVEAGHEVLIAGRTPERAALLAERIGAGARHGTPREAAGFGDVVLVAIRHEGVLSTLRDAGAAEGAFQGKTIIDCNNPVEVEDFTLVTPAGTSLAERIQDLATGSNVVKAFNLCQARVWEMRPPAFDGRPLAVPFAGDDAGSAALARTLIADLGCVPVRIGPLHRARHLEAMAAVVIGLLFGGADPYTVFNLITPAAA
ncbi:NAD(P)-binding domain-containing protein [Streptosporangium sp. NPDC023615]|uniref:NADPH-dependent F420 reductase n=1 Tax=Streptosporangium sp. NPDC023615 TaxID=3154794 RepID=UPI00343D7A8B